MKRRIGYLGPAGTFSEQAAKAVFTGNASSDCNLYGTIQECLFAVKNKSIDYAVVPIENSIGGAVDITLDWLVHEIKVPIQGEMQLPISYELLAHSQQVNTASYGAIYGHPQALKQCNHYLGTNYKNLEQEPVESSAMAAQIVAEKPDQPVLALANRRTRQLYDLSTVDKKIENNAENRTRFIVLGNEAIDLPSEKMKSTMVVSFPENDLMVLRSVLEVLEMAGLKPLKMESIPMKRKLGEYVFIIDLDTTEKGAAFNQVCDDIRALNCGLRHLGSYPLKIVK